MAPLWSEIGGANALAVLFSRPASCRLNRRRPVSGHKKTQFSFRQSGFDVALAAFIERPQAEIKSAL
jgi:hypothetical protein